MSPTPFMQRTSLSGVQLNTLHQQHTEYKMPANKVHKWWTHDWGLQINQVKTQSTVFSLSTTKEQVKIKLGDRILPQAATPIFEMRKRGTQKLALLKQLSGTHGGGGGITSHSKYSVHLDSATNAWIRSKCVGYSSQDPHEQTRPSTDMGIRTTLGAMKSTPIATMQKTAGVEPLDSRRNAKLLTHREKVKKCQTIHCTNASKT